METVRRTQIQNLLKGLVSWKGDMLLRQFDGPPTIEDITAKLNGGSYKRYEEVQVDLRKIIAGEGKADDALREEFRKHLVRLEEKLGESPAAIIIVPQVLRNGRVAPSSSKKRRRPRTTLLPRRRRAKPTVRAIEFLVGQEVEVSPPEDDGRRLPDAISAVVTEVQGEQISIRFLDEPHWQQQQSVPSVFGIADVVSKPPVTPEGFPAAPTPGDRVQLYQEFGWYDVSFREHLDDDRIKVSCHVQREPPAVQPHARAPTSADTCSRALTNALIFASHANLLLRSMFGEQGKRPTWWARPAASDSGPCGTCTTGPGMHGRYMACSSSRTCKGEAVCRSEPCTSTLSTACGW